MVTDAELLWIETEVLSTLDARNRVVGLWGFGLGVTRDDHIVVFGDETPDDLVAAITAAVEAAKRGADPSIEPSVIEPCRRILEEAGGAVELSGGPSYLIPPGTTFTSGARILRSDNDRTDDDHVGWLRDRNPGSWESGEWDELLDGVFGPWTVAVVGERVASICHTPRKLTDRGAECGIWTHPDFRRQGHAAAATAAWAEIVEPSGRHLFYSTSADNHSSQRVAARLGLRRVGWFWNLAKAVPGETFGLAHSNPVL